MNFTAGGRQIDAKANFFRYESCNANGADESARVKADGNDLGLFLPGDYVQLPIYATRWEVVPVTGTAIGSVRLGTGTVGSSRLTGTVRVVDQSADKTAAGKQFIGSCSSAASIAQGSMCGIRAVGVPVIVKRVILSSSIAGVVQLWACNGDPTLNPIITAGFGANKKLFSANSSSKAIRGNTAGVSPTIAELPGSYAIVGVTLSANVAAELLLTTPFQMDANIGLVVSSFALNRDVLMVADLEE